MPKIWFYKIGIFLLSLVCFWASENYLWNKVFQEQLDIARQSALQFEELHKYLPEKSLSILNFSHEKKRIFFYLARIEQANELYSLHATEFDYFKKLNPISHEGVRIKIKQTPVYAFGFSRLGRDSIIFLLLILIVVYKPKNKLSLTLFEKQLKLHETMVTQLRGHPTEQIAKKIYDLSNKIIDRVRKSIS